MEGNNHHHPTQLAVGSGSSNEDDACSRTSNNKHNLVPPKSKKNIVQVYPENYEPCPNDVLCGWTNHPNVKFHALIELHVQEYARAVSNKQTKSALVSKVYNQLNFIKLEESSCEAGVSPRYHRVNVLAAREKIGQAFRSVLTARQKEKMALLGDQQPPAESAEAFKTRIAREQGYTLMPLEFKPYDSDIILTPAPARRRTTTTSSAARTGGSKEEEQEHTTKSPGTQEFESRVSAISPLFYDATDEEQSAILDELYREMIGQGRFFLQQGGVLMDSTEDDDNEQEEPEEGRWYRLTEPNVKEAMAKQFLKQASRGESLPTKTSSSTKIHHKEGRNKKRKYSERRQLLESDEDDEESDHDSSHGGAGGKDLKNAPPEQDSVSDSNSGGLETTTKPSAVLVQQQSRIKLRATAAAAADQPERRQPFTATGHSKTTRKANAMEGDAQAQYEMGLDQLFLARCIQNSLPAATSHEYHLASLQQQQQLQQLEQHESAAADWFEQAANQGHADAQFELGKCFHDGIGQALNLGIAVKLYCQAAAQFCLQTHHFPAQLNNHQSTSTTASHTSSQVQLPLDFLTHYASFSSP